MRGVLGVGDLGVEILVFEDLGFEDLGIENLGVENLDFEDHADHYYFDCIDDPCFAQSFQLSGSRDP